MGTSLRRMTRQMFAKQVSRRISANHALGKTCLKRLAMRTKSGPAHRRLRSISPISGRAKSHQTRWLAPLRIILGLSFLSAFGSVNTFVCLNLVMKYRGGKTRQPVCVICVFCSRIVPSPRPFWGMSSEDLSPRRTSGLIRMIRQEASQLFAEQSLDFPGRIHLPHACRQLLALLHGNASA